MRSGGRGSKGVEVEKGIRRSNPDFSYIVDENRGADLLSQISRSAVRTARFRAEQQWHVAFLMGKSRGIVPPLSPLTHDVIASGRAQANLNPVTLGVNQSD